MIIILTNIPKSKFKNNVVYYVIYYVHYNIINIIYYIIIPIQLYLNKIDSGPCSVVFQIHNPV